MRTIRSFFLSAVCLIPAASCLAATSDGYELTPVLDSPIRWGAVSMSVLFLLMMSAVAFKNPKRTHLD